MRVLLVDDHALFRAGLASLLRTWGLQVVGQASDGEEAIALSRELRPDLIFMDINMPKRNGLETTRVIKTEFPGMKVIMLTVSDNEQDLFEAIKSGAEGYLLKNLREEEFADLVTRVARDEPAMSANLAKKLLLEFARQEDPKRRLDSDEVGLTDREHEVLEQVAKGHTNKEIGATLYISDNTVNYHMKNILNKLHLRNRAEVVAWSIQHGVAGTPPASGSS